MDEDNMEEVTPTNDEEVEVGEEQAIKAEDVASNYSRRLEKANAESTKLKKEAEAVESSNKDLKAEAETETPKKEEQSDEPDYKDKIDKLTLKTEGVTHSDDVKIVTDEAKRLDLPVEEVLGMEHIKSKLGEAKTQREAEAGMPDSSGKTSGGNKSSVDYWVNKTDKNGMYKNPPGNDVEFNNKVIDARIKQKQDGSKFSDEMF